MLLQREFEAKQQLCQQMRRKKIELNAKVWHVPFSAKWSSRLCRLTWAFGGLETIQIEFLAHKVETACIPVCRHC